MKFVISYLLLIFITKLQLYLFENIINSNQNNLSKNENVLKIFNKDKKIHKNQFQISYLK